MKKIGLLALAALPTLAMAAENPYVLNGKVGHLNAPAKAYLVIIRNGASVIDSANIKNGSFQFKGISSDISWATLFIDHEGRGFREHDRAADTKKFYIDKGTLTITAKDSIKNAVITGSAVNKDAAEYEQVIAPIEQAIAEYWRAHSGNLSDDEAEKSKHSAERRTMEQLQLDKEAIQEKYIRQHPDSYFSLRALMEVVNRYNYIAITTPIYTAFSDLYKGLSPTLRDSLEGRTLGYSLKGALATQVGAPAPDFSENDVNDQPVKLSDFKGKYVLLDFWASWCKPCRADNPNVVKAYQQYKNKAFTILSVSLDRPGKKEDWLKAIKTDGLEWTQVSALNFWKSKAVDLYSVQAVPTNFLIDPNGKIVAKNLHGAALNQKLAEIFDTL